MANTASSSHQPAGVVPQHASVNNPYPGLALASTVAGPRLSFNNRLPGTSQASQTAASTWMLPTLPFRRTTPCRYFHLDAPSDLHSNYRPELHANSATVDHHRGLPQRRVPKPTIRSRGHLTSSSSTFTRGRTAGRIVYTVIAGLPAAAVSVLFLRWERPSYAQLILS